MATPLGQKLIESFFATHDVPEETRRAAANFIRNALEPGYGGSEESGDIRLTKNALRDQAIEKCGDERKASIGGFFRILRDVRLHFRLLGGSRRHI
jgi:hypothetical protein